MTLAIFLSGAAASLALFALVLGRMIKFGHETDEHPIPSDQDARLIELHRAIHGEWWRV